MEGIHAIPNAAKPISVRIMMYVCNADHFGKHCFKNDALTAKNALKKN